MRTVPRKSAGLVSLDTGDFDAQVSLEELAELARSARAEVRGSVLQRRFSPDRLPVSAAGGWRKSGRYVKTTTSIC